MATTHARRHLRLLIPALVLLLAACDHYAAARTAGPSGAPGPGLTPVPAPAALVGDDCRPPSAAPPVTVALIRRSDGGCEPLSDAFLYRCDPAMPAVAVIRTTTGVRRFLGGAYAVEVPGPPETAFPIGVTDFGALFQDPSQPDALWIEADGLTKRWLAIPNETKLSQPVTLQLIGDSILDGGQYDIVDQLPTWTTSVDALVGRGSDGAAGVAESLPDPIADVVVVEVGVNDHDPAATAANAQRIIQAVDGTRLLVWLTAHGPESAVPEINQVIRQAMGGIPNGAVLDWDHLVPLDALSSDGIHPDTGQQGVLASIVVPYLRVWREAAESQVDGPTGCQSAIRTAE